MKNVSNPQPNSWTSKPQILFQSICCRLDWLTFCSSDLVKGLISSYMIRVGQEGMWDLSTIDIDELTWRWRVISLNGKAFVNLRQKMGLSLVSMQILLVELWNVSFCNSNWKDEFLRRARLDSGKIRKRESVKVEMSGAASEALGTQNADLLCLESKGH